MKISSLKFLKRPAVLSSLGIYLSPAVAVLIWDIFEDLLDELGEILRNVTGFGILNSCPPT